MEDTLWAIHFINHLIIYSLNPCFNGRYSLSPKYFENEDNVDVLILVLMEDTLWESAKDILLSLQSLNPCFNGRYSLSCTLK